MGALLAALLNYGPMILGLLPEIPNVVNKVQSLFGPTQNAGHGADKLQGAVALIKQLAPELESAFNASPVVKAVIEGMVNIAVSVAQIEGTLTGSVPATSAVAALSVPVPAASPVSGSTD